jgi:hypothetical protein
MVARSSRTNSRGVDSVKPDPKVQQALDLTSETESTFDRQAMIERIRKGAENEKVEPVTLEGMLGIGKPIDFGEVILYVPPLKLKQLPEALKLIEESVAASAAAEVRANSGEQISLSDPSRMAQMQASLKIVHMALVRNYPDITMDDLEGIIDLVTLDEAMEAVLAMSRITVKN